MSLLGELGPAGAKLLKKAKLGKKKAVSSVKVSGGLTKSAEQTIQKEGVDITPSDLSTKSINELGTSTNIVLPDEKVVGFSKPKVIESENKALSQTEVRVEDSSGTHDTNLDDEVIQSENKALSQEDVSIGDVSVEDLTKKHSTLLSSGIHDTNLDDETRSLLSETRRNIIARTGDLSIIPSDRQFVSKIVEDAVGAVDTTKTLPQRLADATGWAYRSSMLATSAPLNVIGSTVKAYVDPIIEMLGKDARQLARGEFSHLGENWETALNGIHDLNSCWKDAFSLAKEAFMKDQSFFNKSSFMLAQRKVLSGAAFGLDKNSSQFLESAGAKSIDFLGGLFSIGTRSVRAGDELVAQLSGRASVRRYAAFYGSKFGKLNGDDLQGFIGKTLNNISLKSDQNLTSAERAIKKFAQDDSLHTNFMHKVVTDGVGDRMVQFLAKLANQNPNTIGAAMPFVTGIYNANKLSIQMTPGLQFLNASFRRELADPLTRNQAVGKMVLGFGIFSSGFFAASNGLITGFEPFDINERKTREAAGIKSCSILGVQIGDKIPTLAPMFLAASLYDLYKKYDLSQGQMATINQVALTPVLAMLDRANFAKDLLKLFGETDKLPDNLSRLVARVGSNLLPAKPLWTQIAQNTFGIKDTSDWIRSLKAGMHLSDSKLDPKTDIFGQDVYGRKILGVGFEDDAMKNSPVGQAVANDHLRISDMNRYMSGSSRLIDLKDLDGKSGYSVFYEMKKALFKPERYEDDIVTALNKLVTSKEYQSLSPEFIANNGTDSPRNMAVNNLINHYKTAARLQVAREYPDLRSAVNTIRSNTREIKSGKTSTPVSKDSIRNQINTVNNINSSGL